MKKIVIALHILLLVACSSDKIQIKGTYVAISESVMFETISFDGTVASFGGRIGNLMPSYTYKVKEKILYIETEQGILTFEIIDKNTIKGMVSIVRGDLYKKQK